MRKKVLLLLLMIKIYSYCHSQLYKDIINFNWETNKIYIGANEKIVLYFEDAIYPDHFTFLPYYNKIYSSIGNFNPVDIKIDSIQYDIIKYDDYKEYIKVDQLEEEFSYKIFKMSDNKTEQLVFQILPLSKQGNNIKRIKKLFLTIRYINKNEVSLKERSKLEESITNSVLSQGTWYKFKIFKKGLYKISYEELKNIGLINIDNIRIYGNGGNALPSSNKEFRKRDLQEVPIIIEKGSDGVFNKGDYIIFYAEGPVTTMYNGNMLIPKIHPYSDYISYFLTVTSEKGKEIVKENEIDSIPEIVITSFDEYLYHENDLYNLIGSGMQWVGEKIITNFQKTFDLVNYTGLSNIKMMINLVSRSSSTRTFRFYINDNFLSSLSIASVNFSDFTGIYARERNFYKEFKISGNTLKLNIEYDGTQFTDEGYLDYIYLNYERKLIYNGYPLFFRSLESIKHKFSEFVIDNVTDDLIVWDITDINNIKEIKYRYNSGKAYFKVTTGRLRDFVAFRKDDIKESVEFVGKVENQNLHSLETPDLIIVTHPNFINQARRLANFRRDFDKFDVALVTTEQIYNEFSSGVRDATAIRDFVRMLYLKNKKKLKYLLLFGDGSFANKFDKQGNTNFIPTIQSKASLEVYGSYTTDDFYGFLDENEGNIDSLQYYMLDIAVGRIPVGDTVTAAGVVDKIIKYSLGKDKGGWQNTIVFIGDDEDNNLHMYQANQLADYVINKYPEYFVKKILLDAYKQESSSVGKRYPEANRSLQESFFQGMLILNYVGHGLETGLAEERIISYNDLLALRNNYKLPFFIASTCEFSRFDNVSIVNDKISEIRSGGEMALLNPYGGAIAMWSTTRVALSSLNYALNRKFYENCFKKIDGKKLRLGEIIMNAKNSIGIDQNKLYYILLGDPSLDLRFSVSKIIIDTINESSVELFNDTLKAYGYFNFKGSITNDEGECLNNFNGKVEITILDKPKNLVTLANDGGAPFSFQVQENIIFKGVSIVKNGKFDFSLYIPKDIDYRVDTGRIIMFAYDSLNNYAGGYFKLLIGSSDNNNIKDTEGPEIKIYMNDTNFKSGGITNSSPVLLVKLKDNYGINTTGNGIGHDLIAYLDDDYRNVIVLNNYYYNYENKYNEGEVRYNLSGLKEGYHKITVKAWDIFNNSSEKSIDFYVVSNNDIIISNAYNYPNPFDNYTQFVFEHNMPGKEFNVEIRIYDITGKIINILTKKFYCNGFRIDPIFWDGTNFNGVKLNKGIYLYQIELKTNDGYHTIYNSKLLIN